MDVPTIIAAAFGALFTTIGAIVGGVAARRGENRKWLLDQQLTAYQNLFDHYSRFTIEIRRAHLDRRRWEYPWDAWNAALVNVSIVAPAGVVEEVEHLGRAVTAFLERAARRDTEKDPLTADEFSAISVDVAEAQRRLVNAIRHSLSPAQSPLDVHVGGAQIRDNHRR